MNSTKGFVAYNLLLLFLLMIGFLKNAKAEQTVCIDDESKKNSQKIIDYDKRQKAQIISKVKGFIDADMDKQVCGSDNLKVIFSIVLTPGGEVSDIRLRKSSGIAACDAALEHIIAKAQPFPTNNSVQNNEISLEIYPNEKL
jgi:colicin import membrane protein